MMSLRAVFAKQSPRRPGDCFISFAMTRHVIMQSILPKQVAILQLCSIVRIGIINR